MPDALMSGTTGLLVSLPLFRITVFTALDILEAVLVYQCLFWYLRGSPARP
jgi:hypothetical protein